MSTVTPYGYALRVDGHLDRHWRSRFGDLELAHHDDGTSTLAGPVADQSQLHGLLAGLRDIGATLLSVRPVHHPGPDKGSPPPTLHSLEGYRATFEEPDRLATTLIVERDGEVIGDLLLRIEDAWAQTEVAVRARGVQAELGWVLDPAHTGHGYETEAVRELLRLCFDELDLRRVVARCFSDNEASWRLMERLGMRRELHAVRESLHRSGEWLDVYGYAMLACERHAQQGGTA
jgi:RimJ/RimL family protein N-acetyltransferase